MDLSIDTRESEHELEIAFVLRSKHPPGHAWHFEDRFTIFLRLAHPVVCRVNGTRANWVLVGSRGTGVVEDPSTVLDDRPSGFRTIVPFDVDAELARLTDESQIPNGPIGAPFDAAVEWAIDRGGVSAHRRQVLDAVSELSRRALATCDRRALALASHFHEDVRLFVYGALVSPARTRVAQMIAVCPALFVLAADRWHLETLAGIERGDRLPHLLRALTDRPAIVRRAPIDIAPSRLRAVLSARGIALEDIPDDHHRWFDRIASASQLQQAMPFERDRTNFGAFVSKHALELEDHQLIEIADWIVHGAGVCPDRRSSVARILDGVAAWHEGLWRGHALEFETVLADAPAPPVLEDLAVRALRTVGELVAEGREMHHCVAGYAERAHRGEVFVYSGRARGQRITIAIAPRGRGWTLVEAAGAANQAIEAPDLVQRFVSSLCPPRP